MLPPKLDLDAVSERLQPQLHEREKEDPGSIAQIDYALRLLAHLRECMPSETTENGRVGVFFHFSMDPGTQLAIGTTVEIRDSSISEQGDRKFLECAETFHSGNQLSVPDAVPDQDAFHWATDITLPTQDDPTYGWFC
jgi:hypothetical protein